MNMKIATHVADFGNSMTQHIINGTYFELPSSAVELTEEEAKASFASSVPIELLHKHIVLRVDMPDANNSRYFKVGAKAAGDLSGNEHIFELHDKTQSETVLMTWLAGLAFYHAKMQPSAKDGQIDVGYLGTLLPVWILKQAKSFTEKLKLMEDRLRGPYTFALLTQGFERELLLEVKHTVCRIEGETARFALKYDLNQNPIEEMEARYLEAYAVINDVGGQSQDLCRLQPGLKAAQSPEDFESVTDQSYLSTLEKLRKDKLMDVFKDVRALETFIVNGMPKRQFIYSHPITHKDKDITDVIVPVLQDFAAYAMQKALQAFTFGTGQTVKYIHIGGVNQLLQPYMKAYLIEILSEKIVQEYHDFPPESRKLNINACEIIAKNYVRKQAELIAHEQA